MIVAQALTDGNADDANTGLPLIQTVEHDIASVTADAAHDKYSFGYISTVGEVHRGFATSTRSILPTLFRCLDKVAEIRGARPNAVFVTGHSMGGALAQHLVSAVLLGDRYGPGGTGPEMPVALRDWPWKQIKLITYGAPRTGDEAFARELTVSGLESGFFTTVFNPQDSQALRPADASIVPRLTNPLRPAGYRVLMTRDPITTEKVVGGKHVGKTVYINRPSIDDMWYPESDAHQPPVMRQFLFDIFADDRIPPPPWRYREMGELNPERVESDKGSVDETRKLVDVIERFYAEGGIWFDSAALNEALRLRFEIANGR